MCAEINEQSGMSQTGAPACRRLHQDPQNDPGDRPAGRANLIPSTPHRGT
jgi:hypothetical protein